MKQINDKNTIEQYLDGVLDLASQEAFEKRIIAEPELAREVAIWQVIMKGIQEDLEGNGEFIIDDIQMVEKMSRLHDQLEDRGFYKDTKE